ncbi:hypothetical protein TH1_061 [Shewanella phage Thanatos-1]|nr:hypothetical protein TH1_061 [Shewanella phage Thanatos-1]QLA10632.1 hypothetical protein TH2_064 [Shewanella phage Thanatos-2]
MTDKHPLNLWFDIDNTITAWNPDRIYESFQAIPGRVEAINALYDQGHRITLYTSRGMNSVGPENINQLIVPRLEENLKKIGLKYHELRTHKPVYDYLVDDRAMRPEEFFSTKVEDLYPSMPPLAVHHITGLPLDKLEVLSTIYPLNKPLSKCEIPFLWDIENEIESLFGFYLDLKESGYNTIIEALVRNYDYSSKL